MGRSMLNLVWRYYWHYRFDISCVYCELLFEKWWSRLCLNMYIVDESCIELWIAMLVLLLVGSSLLTPFSSLVRYSSSWFICIYIQFGETIIDTSARKLYTKKVNGTAIERGVAFPVCVSINDVICNNCPLASDELVSRWFHIRDKSFEEVWN